MGGVWEDSLFLCPSTVVGFAFAAKRWGRMYVDKFQPIEFDDMAYEGLVLDEDTKDMIKGLVQHGVGSGIKDLISGKGVGTIFLLHGNPGMGKTLTAEAVAELLHKPLYSVTVGELGTDASTLEYQLSDVLKIASSWKAVLLLDEADVFLERRNSADVHRNAMVGIFLRLLEYHQGILFLTTNRIASFDPAFASRINVALKYDDLQVAARTTIWRRCLQNVCGAESTEFSDSDLANLAAAELNGRQIRSIVKTAKCIATSKGVELGMRHVNIVLGVADKFTRDLKKAEEEAKQVV
ncbi:P-loop containing nucleoside triphosphate hydrolase protein [Gonapodya prolifera JEL478]|uniref:p-loop containing nucleoside triphosphate hydrolase protein n=1 Tax=Gonapodya prolifera (strain JEL478) TaxID=1344416 RepID=A0A139AAY7_GONPJ|nr:P-loop containing nucleoside triphosphate hydrolase protein [Gonapodya prolifera JEL478]|eukprot:KXS13553.1 P-loop containing nucleoside triphosphate hydrolase protein [Gonapodya prolifera JEL478]